MEGKQKGSRYQYHIDLKGVISWIALKIQLLIFSVDVELIFLQFLVEWLKTVLTVFWQSFIGKEINGL